MNQNRKKIKIKFVDFWNGFNPKNHYLFKLINESFDIELSEAPDYIIYSAFGHDHLNFPKKIKIFYTGECVVPDFNVCDYALGFHHLQFEDRYMRFPLYLLYEGYDELRKTKVINPSLVERKFCNFVYSNGGNSDPLRNYFFEELSKYKKVDSGGRFKNNIDGPVVNKMDFIKDYKFTIAFENSSYNGYTTEKIMQPMQVNSIPVYYGDPQVDKDFNPKSFIWVKEKDEINAVIDKIIELDNNYSKYLNVLSEPWLSKGQANWDYRKGLGDFLSNIFNQDINKAKKIPIYGSALNYLEEHRTAFHKEDELLPQLLISLIICTFNRADILALTLPTYKKLRIPNGIELELIIIDNNSNDNTREFIDTYKKEATDLNIYYYFEAEQGLSHARNTGYKHAKGQYIAYIDDECILPEQWLEVAQQVIIKEQAAFLGGPYYGKFLFSNSHPWFKESFGDSYILQYHLADGKMPEGRYLSGGNMIIRRDVFDKIGLFDTSLGMNGDIINYGEEQDFQKRLIEQHPSEVIWYCPELFVWHGIRTDKISISYLFKEALIRGAAAQKGKDHTLKTLFFSPFLLIVAILRVVFSFLVKFVKSTYSRDHFFSLLYADYQNAYWRDIGGLFEKVKRLFSLK